MENTEEINEYVEKVHINEYISKISNAELMKAAENAFKSVHQHTVADNLNKIYFEPLMGSGYHTMQVSYDFVFHEITKRLLNTPHLKREFELINI